MTGKRTARDWAYLCGELRYYAVLGGLALMAPLSLTALLWLLPTANAVDNWQVDGAGGVLEIRGAMTESACRLEMDSLRQEIWLGEVATGRLEQPGARGTPVAFELRLRDCLRGSAASRDERTGARSWAADQPAVRVSFRAPADADNPQLVKAQGVSGMGLRLLGAQGEDIRLGSRGKPLWLTPGSNVLNYSVMAERTGAPLWVGSFDAVVDFSLNYD
ncbi:type 1 fimbrial protein [Serratia marcescens]|uniref:fimbrial protein n=1 Tax=Serratia TaxID=613 RepID=UPI00083E8014|nr:MULTISPECIES: fimbrial protein [Serratia]AUO01830.1 type 1 fimbrial protein [Serratia marcescens]MBH2899163.1 type 1 fimbrial protein [Serratia ureilytica]MBH2989694.1 type 1 fimbrial protein [Serratia ureilytica]MBH3016419.1 type 1 fimbrial protein [Serratia ureilytica]MBH3031970.1 type 1 fimbrial protein [Serratia ureilytica]